MEDPREVAAWALWERDLADAVETRARTRREVWEATGDAWAAWTAAAAVRTPLWDPARYHPDPLEVQACARWLASLRSDDPSGGGSLPIGC